MPEWLRHSFASDSGNFSKYELDMNDRHAFCPGELKHLFSVRDHPLGKRRNENDSQGLGGDAQADDCLG